ncbi:tmed5 [Pungitius sinensis]
MEAARATLCVLSVFGALFPGRSAVLASFSQALDSDFTFTLAAGRRECFFQTMKSDASLEIEYQILDGSGLDVDFVITSPSGQVVFSDYHKSDGVHTVVDTEDGDYMFCFDNTFSAVSEKLVFFELILDNMEQEEEVEDWKEYVQGTDVLDMKLEDIMDTINNVKARLGKSVHIQTMLRAFEARDRNIQESNFDRVNFWSVVNVVVMTMISALQVYLVRSLFEDKRKIRT